MVATKSLVVLLLLGVSYVVEGKEFVQRDPDEQAVQNDMPIIGVLAQEITNHLSSHFDGYYSFIAASYVKFVEGAGARAVPVWIDHPKEYYAEIMQNLNGIIFPGGASWFERPAGYSEAGRHIYDLAEKMNDDGNYFPLWGTCLGFELLTYLDANGVEHRASCDSDKQPLPLNFKSNFRESRMFGKAPDDIIEILKNEDVTANFHHFCTTEQNLTDFGLAANWRVISTNEDWNGFTFISTMEHTRYPFYGVQFHPEKNIYEWSLEKNITHTASAIRASQYFAQFFINEARRNPNKFSDTNSESQHLIYNYPRTFTGRPGVKSIYSECYLFDKNVTYASIPADVHLNNVNNLYIEF